MNTMPASPDPNGLQALASALLTTLQEEQTALQRLDAQFEAQLDAVQTRDVTGLEETTLQANDEIAALDRLRQTRERQTRLLGRVLHLGAEQASLSGIAEQLGASEDGAPLSRALLEARRQVRGTAEKTRRRCSDLEFTLQYAVDLGHEMLQALQGLEGPAASRIYTATGAAAPSAAPRSLVNRTA